MAEAGTVLAERRTTLEPDLASPSAARRLLRDALAGVDRDGWLDAGELAITEVVTNAALYARTRIDLLVQVESTRLLVEVRDFSPSMPVRREYDDHATTGRGMALVAALTTECGVHSLGPEGKIVWFCVTDAAEQSEEELLAAWDLDGDWDAAPTVECCEVVLQRMPATLWLAARQHHDAMIRELVLYMAEHDDLEVDLASADRARSLISNTLLHALEEAERAGSSRPAVPAGHPSPLRWVPADLDLQLSVPAEMGPAYAAMQDALDAAERLAVESKLLLRPGLPEIIAVRDWACDQVIAQLAGAPPSPWPGTAQERFETELHDRHEAEGPEWDTTLVTGAQTGVVAADDANRIVAISAPLAALLGWEVDDLVGRRVVTLIPPSLREAHVAGFSRHLSTGEAHVLGVPLELPVLRADGTEVQCRFLVERAPANPGRSVYLAWIDPLD